MCMQLRSPTRPLSSASGRLTGLLNHSIPLNVSTRNVEGVLVCCRFCMGIHDDAVKAMRYPENAHKDSFESAGGAFSMCASQPFIELA